MRTVQRKAQEVAARERMFVGLALEMVKRVGFHNLTLGKLATEAGYSKGTVYNHFTCREDLLIELSTENARQQLRYYQAVADLPLGGVSALYALALAYLRHAEVSPVLFESSITARTEAVCALASEERMRRRDLVESQMAQVVSSVVDRTVTERAFDNAHLTPDVAVDALRSSILGYAATHLLSERFLWSTERDAESQLLTLAAMVHGLGWPYLGLDELRALQRTVVGVVDGSPSDVYVG
ncbi:TetR/AcrR family transcriptional regulator [Streptomyces cylindrosporus]|uniref:TetR/AcrR family transcriptional regulator n=1 Tax=Streptomyces cylindrosporus TaxID=2927583 RepID=A0ABS9YCV3_9ACTN|nr:TetR/AcrR family transcriptional regulator [Streptomyces cylindrosporus]MCI3275059.1 TetR/AcrR family transcriptional regulator [Streptomyces cylindrosporus]